MKNGITILKETDYNIPTDSTIEKGKIKIDNNITYNLSMLILSDVLIDIQNCSILLNIDNLGGYSEKIVTEKLNKINNIK